MVGQPLNDSGHARHFQGEGGEDGKPTAMPVPDANTNKHYLGRSGQLKAGRPSSLGGSGGTFRNQHIKSVQRSRRKK